MRAQLSLPALGLAFLVLTAVTVLGVAVADGAVVSAERDTLDRQAALTLSDRLVSADGPLTAGRNTLAEASLTELNATTLRTQYGLSADADARLTLDGTTLVSTGPVDDGRSVDRLVVVRERHNRTLTPAFTADNSITLPRRTDRVSLTVRPAPNNTVTTVSVGDRVMLHNRSGLRGTFTVYPSPLESATVAFDSNRTLHEGSVRITYQPVVTRKARLGVTVDG